MTSGDNSQLHAVMLRAIARVLTPLARLLIRYGVPYVAFQEVARRTFVRVAEQDFLIEGRKQSSSRVSVLTGIPRKEVAKLREDAESDTGADPESYSRTARVVAGWKYDPAYIDGRGRPRKLTFDNGSPNFSELVRKYGADVPARAILDELLRVGAALRLKDSRIRLKADAYVPATAETEKLDILGADVADLIASIEHNLDPRSERGFFQRKVAYDNIPVEACGPLADRVAGWAEALIKQADRTMARSDRDVNPKLRGTGKRRMMLGIYTYEEDLPDNDDE